MCSETGPELSSSLRWLTRLPQGSTCVYMHSYPPALGLQAHTAFQIGSEDQTNVLMIAQLVCEQPSLLPSPGIDSFDQHQIALSPHRCSIFGAARLNLY